MPINAKYKNKKKHSPGIEAIMPSGSDNIDQLKTTISFPIDWYQIITGHLINLPLGNSTF